MVPPSLRQQLFRQDTDIDEYEQDNYDQMRSSAGGMGYSPTGEIMIKDETENIMKRHANGAIQSDIKPMRGGGIVDDDLY